MAWQPNGMAAKWRRPSQHHVPEGPRTLAGGEASPRAGTTGAPPQSERTPAGVPETSAAPAGADAHAGLRNPDSCAPCCRFRGWTEMRVTFQNGVSTLVRRSQ